MGKKITREDVIAELRRIAFARPNAAVELAFLDKPTKETIRHLDLSAVSEFKRNSAGSVEIRFTDRTKALDTLYAMLGGGEPQENAEAFLRALEQAGEEEPWQE